MPKPNHSQVYLETTSMFSMTHSDNHQPWSVTMKAGRLIVLFLLIIFLPACNDSSSDNSEKYRFYVEFTNHAWGFVQKGLFINNNGEVYFYQLDHDLGLNRDGSYNAQELDSLFANNQSYLTNIDPSDFANMVNLSQSVQTDQMTDPENTCVDAGIYRYSAFDYNVSSEEYSDVLLYQTGDWRIVNNDASAIILRDWLISLALEYNIAMGVSGYCTGLAVD